MRLLFVAVFGIAISASCASAEGLKHFQTLYDAHSVETPELVIEVHSAKDDVHFSIVLRDKESGPEKRYEFEGEGSTDPSPFQLEESYLCGAPVILLTVQYPWRHALPEFVRVLDTFAFRRTDFGFIDMAYGPLTDIALADDSAYDPADLEMLPPIRVRCLTGRDERPFEFFRQETR